MSKELTKTERVMLRYALDLAQEEIWSEGGFTDEEKGAVESLRRLVTPGTEEWAWTGN